MPRGGNFRVANAFKDSHMSNSPKCGFSNALCLHKIKANFADMQLGND